MLEIYTEKWFYWTVAGLVAAYGCRLLYRGVLRDRARGRPRCPGCWYDLGGAPTVAAVDSSRAALTLLPVTCPECGRVVKTRRQLHRIRRHWGAIVIGVLLISLAAYGYEVRYRLLYYGENWKTALVPSTAYIIGLQWVDKKTFEIVETRHADRTAPVPGPPQARGFWKWQERLYRDALSRVVTKGPLPLNLDALYTLLWMANEGDFDALAIFISHLDHPHEGLRLAAMSGAQTLGERMTAGRDEVLARLEDENPSVRQATLLVLTQIGPRQCESLSDDRLCEVAGMILRINGGEGLLRDWYLTEMMRRRSPGVVKWLRGQVAAPPLSRWGDDVRANLELVTALRRIEGREGPLMIEIAPAVLRSAPAAPAPFRVALGLALPPVDIHAAKSGLPVVKAAIFNIDPDGVTIGFQRHGDNRGERPMRWRFVVRNLKGEPMPLKLESMNFGGKSSYGTLGPGDRFDIVLDMATFVQPLPPGEYRVIVQYHDQQQISGMADVSKMIMVESKEMKLFVAP
jgi:hypothetical protein